MNTLPPVLDKSSGSQDKPWMVFVFPHFDERGSGFVDGFSYSLGIGYIRAYLAQRNIPTAQYIQFEARTVREAAEEILALGADIVGFSCLEFSLYACVIIADSIKNIKPDTTIIFGGPSATLADDLIMNNNRFVDICCRGESEEICYELLLKLRKGEDIDGIAGITFRKNGQIIRTPDRPLLRMGPKGQELDFLPSPFLNHFIPAEIKSSNRMEEKKQIILLTARGCTHKCIYCANTALCRNSIRYHSIERVIDEIKYISERVLPQWKIMLADDAFTLNIERAKKICRRIIEESLNHLEFSCITRIDKSDNELFELMVKAGFTAITFGLESASPRILNIIKKVRSTPAVNDDYGPELKFLETMKQNVRMAAYYGLNTAVSIIQGLPGETKKEAEETLKFLEQLNVKGYVHNYLTAIYGTEVHRTGPSYGIGIRPSPSQLPLIREFAYNVFEIKPLKNAINTFLYEKRAKDNAENFLCFMGVKPKGYADIIKNSGIMVLIDDYLRSSDNEPLDEAALFSWLSGLVQFTSEVYMVDNNWNFSYYEKWMIRLADLRMPVEYRMVGKEVKPALSRVDSDPGSRIDIRSYTLRNIVNSLLSTEKYQYDAGPHYRYHILPFVSETNCPLALDLHHEIKIKSIDSVEDLEEILKWCKNSAAPSEFYFNRDDVSRMGCEILDRCRWTGFGPDYSCDACPTKKLIVGKDGSIRTCYSGLPLGSVGNSIQQLTANFETLQLESYKRRECNRCAVKSHCPKCLFLSPFLSESRYCGIMREYPGIPVAINTFALLRHLPIQKNELLKDAKGVRVSNLDRLSRSKIWHDSEWVRFLPRMLKVCIESRENTHLLYHVDYNTFSNLSRTMGEIWDHLLADESLDKETLCEKLANERNLSYNSMVNAFDMLVKKIEELGKQSQFNSGAKGGTLS